jgi:1-acyl-sn-glycerol-3-phosphate acyltransferase
MKAIRLLYNLYAVILFVGIFLCLFPFMLIAALFGPIRGGNAMLQLCGVWADIWLFCIGIRTKVIHEQPLHEIRPCIYVANHISYMDIPMIVKILRDPIRPLGKVEMSKIPLFGFMYRNVVVTVDRSSSKHRAESVARLKAVLKADVSIFIFPEGTFNEGHTPLKSFYDGAFRIALQTGAPIQPILFPDTRLRMPHTGILTITPGLSRAVYLDLIQVDGLTEADLPQLKSKVYEAMEAGLYHYAPHWKTQSAVL